MAIPSRGIGWGTEENLLWQISKQIEKLTCVTAGGCGSITTTTTTTLPVYRVYTALLTQSGGDDPAGENGGTAAGNYPELTIGRTYYIADNFQLESDFTNIGAPNNNVGTYFVATGTTPASWGTYALLQYNTGAPVATVLQNTLEGTISFHYSTEGNYVVVNSIPWDQAKTTFQLEQGFSDFGSFVPSFVPITGGGKTFLTFSNTGTAGSVPPNILPPSNGVLNKSLVEIRVYN